MKIMMFRGFACDDTLNYKLTDDEAATIQKFISLADNKVGIILRDYELDVQFIDDDNIQTF